MIMWIRKTRRYDEFFPDIDLANRSKRNFQQVPEQLLKLDVASHLVFWGELLPVIEDKKQYAPYHLNNHYSPIDDAILFAMVRKYKPKRVIEIGAGESTYTLVRALKQNKIDGYPAISHKCIEPFRRPKEIIQGYNLDVVNNMVQEVDQRIFTDMVANDILFINSSQVATAYGDVLFEVLFILPLLKPGVFVHLHGIYLPYDYPDRYTFE